MILQNHQSFSYIKRFVIHWDISRFAACDHLSKILSNYRQSSPIGALLKIGGVDMAQIQYPTGIFSDHDSLQDGTDKDLEIIYSGSLQHKNINSSFRYPCLEEPHNDLFGNDAQRSTLRFLPPMNSSARYVIPVSNMETCTVQEKSQKSTQSSFILQSK